MLTRGSMLRESVLINVMPLLFLVGCASMNEPHVSQRTSQSGSPAILGNAPMLLGKTTADNYEVPQGRTYDGTADIAGSVEQGVTEVTITSGGRVFLSGEVAVGVPQYYNPRTRSYESAGKDKVVVQAFKDRIVTLKVQDRNRTFTYDNQAVTLKEGIDELTFEVRSGTLIYKDRQIKSLSEIPEV